MHKYLVWCLSTIKRNIQGRQGAKQTNKQTNKQKNWRYNVSSFVCVRLKLTANSLVLLPFRGATYVPSLWSLLACDSFHKNTVRSSLVAHQVKDPGLSLCHCCGEFDVWSLALELPHAMGMAFKKKKKKKKKKCSENDTMSMIGLALKKIGIFCFQLLELWAFR